MRYETDIRGSNINVWDDKNKEGMVISYVDKERRTRIYANNVRNLVKEMNKLYDENQKLKDNSQLFNYLVKQLDEYIDKYGGYYTKYGEIQYLEVMSILENIKHRFGGR